MERTAITGNTFPVKDQLKALGGTWNPDIKAWMVPSDKADEARRIVGAAPAKAAHNHGPTKTCWECGRRFTYFDCKRNDGDWNESYCGC